VDLISAMGTASVTLGMIVTIVVALSNPLQWGALPVASFPAFPSFFGTVAFLFFIHFTLFPIQEGMKNPKYFVPAVTKAFIISMFVGAAFGIFAAAGFGPGVNSVVITMLTGPTGLIVKGLLCVNLLFTFPIMARSCFLILEDLLKGDKPELALAPSLGVRTAFVILAATLATSIPNFGAVLGYVGGVCCCSMTLAMPPLILYLAQKKANVDISAFELTKIGVVGVVGIVCIILSIVL